MGKYSKDEINKIIDLKDGFGHLMNVFELRGEIILKDRNPKNAYNLMVSDNVNMTEADFEDCQTEQEVKDTFDSNIVDLIKVNLVRSL